MWVASVVLPTPPFWLSSATIMTLPSMLESHALIGLQNLSAGGRFCLLLVAAWRLSTAAAFPYYKLENLS